MVVVLTFGGGGIARKCNDIEVNECIEFVLCGHFHCSHWLNCVVLTPEL